MRLLASVVKLAAGVVQSFGLLLRRRPQAILLTGGWANAPLAVAAWVLRVPVLVFLPDIEPGLTIRVLRRFARKVAITVPESAVYFREGQTVVTGYPLRESFAGATHEEGIAHFELDPDRKTLLVFGGSLGARSINIALLDILPELLRENVQIIHVTGKLDWPRVQEQLTSMDTGDCYQAFPYLHDMGLALAAADIVVCRSGASTLAELPRFGVASILVPYPHAWRYQKTNADYLTSRGAAVTLADEAMPSDLLPLLRELLNEPGYLQSLQEGARALAKADGAENVAQVLVELGGGEPW